MTVPVLTGPCVTLRQPVETDIAVRRAIGVDPEINRMYGGSRADLSPYTLERAAEWYRGLVTQDHSWVIEVAGQMIGEIRLHSLNEADKRATLAIGIADPQALGRGYGTEATRLVLTHAFSTLGLHRVSLRVLAYNERAIACYAKCGFVTEGRERQSALVDGAWHDDIVMGILAPDFAKQNQ